MYPQLSQLNPVHILAPYFFKRLELQQKRVVRSINLKSYFSTNAPREYTECSSTG